MTQTEVERSHRPRGRPQRLPVDVTPTDVTTLDPTRRLAWLLAVSRLLSPRTRSMSRAEFIDRMREDGIVLDGSRISRWESGAQSVGPRLLAAYETVVGAPEGSLQAVSSLVRRAGGLRSSAEAPVPEHQGLLDETFERIERREASGRDWLRLANDLTSYDRVYLHPTTWTALCGQLVSELTRASGIAAVQRHEAATELMSLPQGSRHLSLSIGRFVMHPDAQNVVPALRLLHEVGDDAAGQLVVRLMGDENAILRRGARGVAGTLAARRRLGSDTVDTVEAYVATELRKGGSVTRRVDALEIATTLPDDVYRRVLAGVGDRRLRRQVELTRSTLELLPADQARGLAEGVATFAESWARRAAHDPDQMLRRLVRESLFHAHRERRALAATMLAVSPYAAAVGDAVLRITEDDDDLVAALGWSMLRRLGHVLDRESVTATALGEPRPALRARALVTAGLGAGPIGDATAQELAARACVDGTTTGLRHAYVFALGMTGHDHLQTLTRQAPEAVRRAASWWRAVGPCLDDGIRQAGL